MRINNNIMAMNTYRQLGITNSSSSKSMEKLSSGLRINRAGDDAAGLAISEKMRAQIRGLNMASKNAQDGISLIQTAEGALQETHSILQRMRELAVQSANDTNIAVDRSEIQKEIDQLAEEITRIANNTEFNQQTLLNGGITADGIGEVKFHIGANEKQDINLAINAMDAYSLGVARDVGELSATVTGTNISNVKFAEEVGSGIVGGATISFDAAPNSGAKATGTININSGTSAWSITAGVSTAGAAYNGITITFGSDTSSSVKASVTGTNTIIITADWDNSNGKAPSLSDIENAIKGLNGVFADITLTSDGQYNASDLANAGTITLIGGADAETIITIRDGTKTQTITVLNSDTKVEVTSGVFKGISFDVKDVTSLASGSDSFEVADTRVKASAATFAGNIKVSDAVAKGGIDVSTQTAASSAITTIQRAIEKVSAERSKLGAYQNRLEHTINNLDTSAENLQASESRIRDVDMAKEMMEFTKQNILQQAATAMLAQANQAPQSVLQLLR
ncbi:MAG TPA: flagellin [Clostridiaceae bacterium]|nr:flagellin [Clostridiaceae bacterium]